MNCHIMAPYYATWFHSSHSRNATCNDCHVPHENAVKKWTFKGMDGMKHVAAFLTKSEPQVIRAHEASSEVIMSNYNGFIRALLRGNVKEMNIYMNEVALSTFSSFDSGKHPSGKSEPERFYHGFVLGLLVELRDKYEVQSNRESGYGRYDVMIIPRDKNSQAVIIEFKVIDSQEETSLDMTADSALKQIEEKNYDAKLLERGYKREAIQHYGFAFEGKKVLIKKAQI